MPTKETNYTFEVNDNEIIKLSRIVCASLNHPHGSKVQIKCSSNVCMETEGNIIREIRESTRRIVDMVLTDGLSPPADCRHVIEQTQGDYPLTSLLISLKNTSLEQFPFLLRQSMYDGKAYTLTESNIDYGNSAAIFSTEKNLCVVESKISAVDFSNSSVWLDYLRRFAYPICRSLQSSTKLFLAKDGLHENMMKFNVCVIAVGKEYIRDAETAHKHKSENLTLFRWYLAIQSKSSKVLITVGYLRTIFSSPQDSSISKNLIRTQLAHSNLYTIDLPSLKNIAANRFTSIKILNNSVLCTIAVQCGFVERFEHGHRGSYKRSFAKMENGITETDIFRLLEPQLCFFHTPQNKPTSIEKLSNIWRKSSQEEVHSNIRMRKFMEKLKSPLFTEFSQKGKRAARLLSDICEKNIAKEGLGLEETMYLELKSLGQDPSDRIEANNNSKSATDKVCKYMTSFLNAHGGALHFGVADSGVCVGVTDNFDILKKACMVGFKGIRPVVPEHMACINKKHLNSINGDTETYVLEFSICMGSAPFYSAGAPFRSPSWGRFLASTTPLHSSVLLERLALYAPRYFKEER